VGTQGVRVLAVDDDGHLVGYGFAALTSVRSRQRHQQNPEHWWHAVVKAANAALTGVDIDAIAGLAVDATSGTILLADPAGHPRTDALMYDDGRAPDQALLVSEVGAPVWDALGYLRMPPSWALPKLIWLLEEHPELATENVRLCHQADLITARLVGHPVATDTSHALKSGYHLLEDRWPVEVFDQLGVPEHILPDVVRPGTILGRVGAEAASVTGIPADTPVVAGMTDGCAAQLGAGALETGSWNSVLGTTLVLKGVSDELIRDPAGVVYCHRGAGDTWLPGGASSSGAGVITEQFANTDLDELTAQTAELPIGPIAYPLVTSGERFPFRAPDADPFVLGDVPNDPAMFGALLLGVACVERLCLDYLDLLGAPTEGPLSFTGGGARNRYWSQLRADLLGRPVRLPAHPEPALGMAVLASTRAGRSLVEAASTMVRVGTELTPDPTRAPVLLQRYNDFLDALTARGWLDAATAAHARTRGQP
jgi:sugar (pentulose or hexulose) kinase